MNRKLGKNWGRYTGRDASIGGVPLARLDANVYLSLGHHKVAAGEMNMLLAAPSSPCLAKILSHNFGVNACQMLYDERVAPHSSAPNYYVDTDKTNPEDRLGKLIT